MRIALKAGVIMLTGKRISGRYKINRMIGGGGMANVYLAHDMILDRDVAVKILRMDFANEEEFIRRFQREAQSATSLTHQNIVSIYDVGEENDVYYIVMEYVDGPTLKQYIQQHHPVTVEKTLDIMKQITRPLLLMPTRTISSIEILNRKIFYWITTAMFDYGFWHCHGFKRHIHHSNKCCFGIRTLFVPRTSPGRNGNKKVRHLFTRNCHV